MEQLTLEHACEYYINDYLKSISPHDSYSGALGKAFEAGAEWQKEQFKETLQFLKAIAEWAGNISDDVLQTPTGPKDAALRGGLICDMRSIALNAIRKLEPDYKPF